MSYFNNKSDEGRNAYREGIPRDQNPYPTGHAQYWQWLSGWLDEQAFRPHPIATLTAKEAKDE